MNYKDLEFLNYFMNKYGRAMNDRREVAGFGVKVLRAEKIISQLLKLTPQQFAQTMKEFNKEHCENAKAFWENLDRELNSRDFEDEYDD